MNKESFLYVVIFTFVVAFVFVFIIALVDNATSERVAQNQKLVTAQAFLNAVGQPETDSAAALSEFKSLFSGVEGESVARANINGESLLVKQFSGQGLWGTVTGVIAVDQSVSTIIGLDIISHSETPGLGGRIEEDWFKDQFQIFITVTRTTGSQLKRAHWDGIMKSPSRLFQQLGQGLQISGNQNSRWYPTPMEQIFAAKEIPQMPGIKVPQRIVLTI